MGKGSSKEGKVSHHPGWEARARERTCDEGDEDGSL